MREKIIQFLYKNGYQKYDEHIYSKNDMLAVVGKPVLLNVVSINTLECR